MSSADSSAIHVSDASCDARFKFSHLPRPNFPGVEAMWLVFFPGEGRAQDLPALLVESASPSGRRRLVAQ